MRLFWMIFLLSLPLFSQDLVTDRPDQSESAVTIAPGSVQVEMGVTHREIDDNFDVTAFGEFLIRTGLSENIELRIGYGGYNEANLDLGFVDVDESGSADSSLGIKWKIRDEKNKMPQTALLVATSLPTGEDGFTSDRAEPAFRFIFSNTLTKRIGLSYNVGMASVTETDGNGEHTLAVAQYTLSLGVAVSDRVSAFVESYGDIPTSASGGPANGVDAGFLVLITPLLQFDVAVGTGISDAAEDWFATTGLSFRFDR